MDCTFTRVMFGLLVVILVGNAITLKNVSRSVAPRTDEEKREAIERTVSNPAVNGVYDPDVVVYATTQLQGIYGDMVNYPDRPVPVDEVLLYLTYLAEGSMSRPDAIDFCSRVRPLWSASHRIGDLLFGKEATQNQQDLFSRIDNAVGQKDKDGACQSTQEVST